MVNYSPAQRRVGCYGDNLLPKVMNVEYLNAYLTAAVPICLMFPGIKLKNSLKLFVGIISGAFWEHAVCILLLCTHRFGFSNDEIFLQLCPNSCLNAI